VNSALWSPDTEPAAGSFDLGSVGADLPEAPRRIRLGMPQLDPGGLSEGWLLRGAGDRHWQAIARRLGVATDEIRGDTGQRLYPTVVAVRARSSWPERRRYVRLPSPSASSGVGASRPSAGSCAAVAAARAESDEPSCSSSTLRLER